MDRRLRSKLKPLAMNRVSSLLLVVYAWLMQPCTFIGHCSTANQCIVYVCLVMAQDNELLSGCVLLTTAVTW